jgi:hypothetical protein
VKTEIVLWFPIVVPVHDFARSTVRILVPLSHDISFTNASKARKMVESGPRS